MSDKWDFVWLKCDIPLKTKLFRLSIFLISRLINVGENNDVQRSCCEFTIKWGTCKGF
jgi:hypothetical protein